MKRKILSLLLACMLLAGLCTGVFAEAQLFHVTDTAGLLTADEDYALEEQAADPARTNRTEETEFRFPLPFTKKK